MAGIEDLVEVYRGENLLEKFKNLRYIKKHKPTWPGLKKTGRFATTKLAHAKEYAGNFPNIIKSAKVDKKIAEFGKNLFDKAHFTQMKNNENYRSRLLLPKKAKEKLKIDILRTISSNIKGLTPLALKGLSIATSLPAQIVVMTLTPTTANADEVNMQLEDFAKLAEEAKPKKEMMAAGGNVPSTDIKDYYRRAWGIGDRVGFKRGKSEALLIRDKAANALKKVIDAGELLEFDKLAKNIEVPATTLKRVYDEKFAGTGVIKRSRDTNKIIDKIIKSDVTDPDKIKQIAKQTYKINVADRAIKKAVNIATDISVAEYEQIFRKMANDRTYVPPIDISAKGKGLTANYIKAKANVKNEIPNLQTLLNQNIAKRKKIKEMKKIAADPDLKTKYLVKKQMIRDKKRFLEAGKITLSKADLALNLNQRTLIKEANELINSNPTALLKDKNLLEKISWRVDVNGNLYQSKPDLTAVLDPKNDARFFHLSHSRRAGLGTQLTDAPVNRFATTFNLNNEFIKDAENFIEKNPNHPNVKKILKKAKELKITLRPDVPLGTFKNAAGNSVRYVGYTKNINKPVDKIKTVIDEFMPKSLLKLWKPAAKQTTKRAAAKILYPAMMINQLLFGDKFSKGPWDFPLTIGEDVKQTNELLKMVGDKLNYFDGGIAGLKK